MPHRYLIIGDGVAGIAAAEVIQRQGAAGDLLLIGDEPHPFYSRPGLAYYLSGELPEKQLFLPQAHPFQRVQARAVAIQPQAQRVTLDNGQTLSYERLLLATGSRAVAVSIPGAELEGVVKLDNLADTQHILKLARRAKRAVVVGGGITALELAEGLKARGLKTYYLLRRDRYWRNVLDPMESSIVERRLAEDGIELLHHTELAQILGKNNRVVGVQTRDGRQLACELVALAVGVKPCLELAEAAGLATDRGILVNEYLQTSAPAIFAAGDVAQVFDPLLGRAGLNTLWPAARAQGEVAGRNMAGANLAYRKEVALNVTRLAGLTTAIIGAVGRGRDDDVIGIVRGDSETWRQLPDSIAAQAQFEVNRLRLMVGSRTLVGAVVMGDQTLSRPLYQLIARQVDITPIREQLLNPETQLADLLTDFWTGWRNTHGAS
jgi:nitrite reductase (NADH) large subunit